MNHEHTIRFNHCLRDIVAFFILLYLLLGVRGIIHAEDSSAAAQLHIEQLQKKITELQGQQNSLSSEINLLDSQMSVTELRISSIKSAISKISNEIGELAGEIVRIESILTRRSELVIRRIPESYKRSQTPQFGSIFLSENFSDLLHRIKYIGSVQADDAQLLFQLKATQNNFSERKDLRQTKKQQQEQLQIDLEKESKELELKKRARQTLLTQTKNDSATYQKLLSQALAQQGAFRAFVSGRGVSILPPQAQPDGWYFNQRDERWGRQCIGSTCWGSPSYTWEVGCLITSVAMLQKKNGIDTNPGIIARNPDFFFRNLMLRPWPAQSGFKFTYYGRNTGVIDSELAAGRPVIVELNVATNIGRHFVVLTSKGDDGYRMNDPWEGYNLKFLDFYSVGNILEVATYTNI